MKQDWVVAMCKRRKCMTICRAAIFLLAMVANVSLAEVPDRISPFIFTENGWFIDSVDFGQVPPASFQQRFIVITNTSSHVLKNVVLKITGNYKVSDCMSEFMPGMACNVILNYKAPAHAGWDIKWLNIEYTIQQDDGSIQADSQQLQVIGGVRLPSVPQD